MRHNASFVRQDTGEVVTFGEYVAIEAAELADSFLEVADIAAKIAATLARIARHPRLPDIDRLEELAEGLQAYTARQYGTTTAVDLLDTLAEDIRNAADDTGDGVLPVEVCPYCMAVAANGAGETSPEHLARYTAAAERWTEDHGAGTHLVATCPYIYGECRNDDGECSAYPFSWSACEWCGDRLGGHREHAAVILGGCE